MDRRRLAAAAAALVIAAHPSSDAWASVGDSVTDLMAVVNGSPQALPYPQVIVFLNFQIHPLTYANGADGTCAQASGGVIGSIAFSGDGRVTGFTSDSSNLVSPDTIFGVPDLFAHEPYHVAPPAPATCATSMANLRTDGTQVLANAGDAHLSGDGRFMAFVSASNALLPAGEDTNGAQDVFVRDFELGATERVSIADDGSEGVLVGAPGTPTARTPDISQDADGCYVAFASRATNLVPGDTNFAEDVFVRDRCLGTTERVSVSAAGDQASADSYSPAISDDGCVIAFQSPAMDLAPPMDVSFLDDIFVRDRCLGTTEQISPADVDGFGAPSYGFPNLSGDGCTVVFGTDDPNLVPGDTNGVADTFVVDRCPLASPIVYDRVNVPDPSTGQSEADMGSLVAEVSANGRWVVFASQATNLVPDDTNAQQDCFVRDRAMGRTARVSLDADGNEIARGGFGPHISSDGRWILWGTIEALFPGDGGLDGDLFIVANPLYDGP